MAEESAAKRESRARAEAAARVANSPLESLIHDRSPEVLRAVASDRRLTEDLALALLVRRDLPQQVLEDIAANGSVMKSRKVILAVVGHPRTPRHVSLPIARHLYTFELMSLALLPALAADLKVAIEEAIILRLNTIAAGERLTLARRASARVASALLMDADSRVIECALTNPYLTEAGIVKALMTNNAPLPLIELVCHHQKWSLRRDVRIALLRNGNMPLSRVIAFAESLPTNALRDVLLHSRLPANVKSYLTEELEKRTQRASH